MNERITCKAAFAKLSNAREVAAAFWLFVVSVFMLQSIWRLVVVVLNEDEDDEDGGERKTAEKNQLVINLEKHVRRKTYV